MISVRRIIRGRRSGTGYDGEGRLSRPACHRLLRRLLPDGSAPLAALPGAPGIHLLLFVHRVEDLAPGLYALIRNPEREGALRAAMSPRFAWAEPPGTPPWLPLRLLEEGDFRRRAALLSCGQEIAGDGALAAAMVADFAAALAARGPAGYRRLHWEAGVLGQLLYLEAEAAGMRGTGIGCFFDDSCHELAGLAGGAWRDLYHFTLGAAREDPRARTLPAYGPEP